MSDVITIGILVTFELTSIAEADARLSRMTLTRTIIGIDVARTVHDSGEGSELLSMGIGVVSRSSFEAPTSVPDPGVASEFSVLGWVWRAAYRIWGVAADQPTTEHTRIDLDIRAQRKLENGVSVVTACLVAIEGANSTATVTGFIRQLWIVP